MSVRATGSDSESESEWCSY